MLRSITVKVVVTMLVASAILSAPVGTVARLQPADGGASTRAQTPASADLADTVMQDDSDAAGPDLEAVREAQGWTTKQLAAYERSEAALDVVTESLSTNYPEAFVGSALADDPAQPPTVYVKGRAPADVRALAGEHGVALVEDQPYSLDELDTRLAAVQKAVFSAGFEDFAVSADIEREGAITLVVAMPSGASLDPVLAGIAPEIAKDITVIMEDHPVVEPQAPSAG